VHFSHQLSSFQQPLASEFQFLEVANSYAFQFFFPLPLFRNLQE
jgi:hypothetical protein